MNDNIISAALGNEDYMAAALFADERATQIMLLCGDVTYAQVMQDSSRFPFSQAVFFDRVETSIKSGLTYAEVISEIEKELCQGY